jgi:hypothetical protein
MFEKAARMKLRFQFRGQCSVEDLWDLNVESLDSIYQEIHTKMKAQKGKSLLRKKNHKDTVLELQSGIVKHIVTVKLKEQEARENATVTKARKEKLLGLLAEKQDESLRDMSEEDLQKLIDEL